MSAVSAAALRIHRTIVPKTPPQICQSHQFPHYLHIKINNLQVQPTKTAITVCDSIAVKGDSRKMATIAQILANQMNSQSSTGPVTEKGKQTASRNNFRHGLASNQLIVPGESLEEFEELHTQLLEEHQPTTITESILVKKMAEHYWLSQRAIRFQNDDNTTEQQFALYLRYQTTNDRAFSKS